jgi:hypothetical protein
VSGDGVDALDDLVRELEDAAARLRAGGLEPEDAAELVEECARLATRAGGELDRLTREATADARPGQGELL